MNLYLDIDWVLIKDGKPANGLREFLEYATENFKCYWLTTHCKSGGNRVNQHLNYFLPKELLLLTEKVISNNWDNLKTDGINFSQPFLWLDDYLQIVEKRVLEQNNCLQNFIEIRLKDNPDQLLEVLEHLKTIK